MTQRTTRVSTGSVSGGSCPVCGGQLLYRRRGPRPTYCSQSCRQRAYELRRAERQTGRDLGAAAASTPPSERIVERVIERPYPTTAAGWVDALAVLADQLRIGQLAGDTAWVSAAFDRIADALRAPVAAPTRPSTSSRSTAPAPRSSASPAAPATSIGAAGGDEPMSRLVRMLASGDALITIDQAAKLVGTTPHAVRQALVFILDTGRGAAWRTDRRGAVPLTADQLRTLPGHARFHAGYRAD